MTSTTIEWYTYLRRLDMGREKTKLISIILISSIFYLQTSSYSSMLETEKLPPLSQNQPLTEQTSFQLDNNNYLIDQAPTESYAQATLDYFINPALGLDERTGLVHNYIVDKGGYIERAGYTSITDIGLQLASISGAYETGMLSENKAQTMISKVIDTLNIMEAYDASFGDFEGCRYYFNYYDLNTLTSNKKVLSSIDNAWLATGLITARETFPNLAEKINSVLEKMDFGLFYNSRRNLFRVGFFYNPETDSLIDLNSLYTKTLYEVMNSETRMISYLAIGKGDLSEEKISQHLQKLDHELIEYNSISIAPSSGGSAFEHGMPTLFVDEIDLSPLGFGINLKKSFYIQMLQAKELNYPIWGESPSTDEDYGYSEFGSPSGKYPYDSRGVITPHASFLALEVLPNEAIRNLENIALLYPNAYRENFGFADAINLNNNGVITKYLALDQGMAFISALNSISGGIIRDTFMNSPEGVEINEAISKIAFFTPDELEQEAEECYSLAERYIAEGTWQVAEVLLDYTVDLCQNYIATGIDLSNIELYRLEIAKQEQLFLNSLYREAEDLIAQDKLSEAERKLIQILAVEEDYSNAIQMLRQLQNR